MRKFVSATGWLMLGVVLALALLEIVLRFLPVPMGLYRTQRYDEWPLQSYEPELPVYVFEVLGASQCASRDDEQLRAHRAVRLPQGLGAGDRAWATASSRG